jgi:predicted metal-dependent peptidase
MANKADTNTADIPTSERYSATEAEGAAFDMDRYMVRLMWDEPFYAKILRGINKKRTKQIPTAGVAVIDGYVHYLWNDRFVASLEKDEGAPKIIGLAIHECLHLAYDHCTTRRRDDYPRVSNYAADLAINCQIPIEKLPSCGIWPGKKFVAVKPEIREKIGEERALKYDALSKLIESMPLFLSMEQYFALLMNDADAKSAIEGEPGEEGAPGGAPGEGTAGDGTGEDGFGSGMPGGMDDHGAWGDMSEEDKAVAQAEIRKAMADAAKDCDQKGSWGSVPAETRAEIRRMIANEVPWQSVLKKFVGQSRRSVRRTSWGKINKKNPMLVPGSKRSMTASIAVYIDQSGSVGNDELEMLFAELGSLAKKTEFTTFHFDTSIDEKSETVWKKGRTPQAHRTRCGGTCFDAVVKHANKNKHRFDGILILTDGYAPKPSPCRMKVGWVITPGGTTEPWMKGTRNFVIKMKEERKSRAA